MLDGCGVGARAEGWFHRGKSAWFLRMYLLSGKGRKANADPPCGSGLAREGGLTADQSFPAKHPIPVGASLLAMAAAQATDAFV